MQAEVRVTRQCAWCRTVADDHGRYSRPATRLLRDATHGICPSCKETFRATIEATYANAANTPPARWKPLGRRPRSRAVYHHS